jgi:crotonobetainyl-CoA:carnitine CoA-transferase CaiB-like acyl-CoA transferase
MAGPLAGLTVVDLTSTQTGAHVTQTLADFGCDVVMIERPGGNPLRQEPAWPFWARGKRSIELDLNDADDLAQARALATQADIVVDTWRPGVAERFGLDYESLAAANPRLVYASITGFGRDNELSHLKAYEPIVMAKIGALDAFSTLSDRPGPCFVASPYCTFSASQLGLHGILAALVDRETTGKGQWVETSLVQGVLAHDTWNWLIRLLTTRYADAFTPAAPTSITSATEDAPATAVIASPFHLRLMVGFTKDGQYMQFSQMAERLWQAFLRLTGLDKLSEDPEFLGSTAEDDPMGMTKWTEKALEITRSKTYAEWLEEFEREPDVWAEMFRDHTELLHHPQMVQDHRTVEIDDPVLGKVLQPGPIVLMSETPAELGASAPALDEQGAAIRAALGASPAVPAPAGVESTEPLGRSGTEPPLAGLTVIELGTYYAAPFGATVLTDLGARVIKVEQLDGDPIRSIMPFPEIGGIKVLQGKESVAVDIASDEGREIVYELVRRADVVLQSFRAGVAERHGYTSADLLAVNPDLVYLDAPGYGIGPPFGQRPAYAPTIGAGSGLAYRNVGGRQNLPGDPSLSMLEVRLYAARLGAATMSVGQADGFSALGVGTAMLLGILARRRGAPGQQMTTSMLSTMAHCLAEDMIEYAGRPELRGPDHDLNGLGARYRLYPTADGWVFLAAPADDEWQALATELDLDVALADDEEALAATLLEKFATATAEEWERRLTKVDVACVAVASGPVEEVVWFGGGLGEKLGIVTEATHPMLEAYPRLTPTVSFSRSETRAGNAPLLGEQTDSVLREIGYDDERIAALRGAGVAG